MKKILHSIAIILLSVSMSALFDGCNSPLTSASGVSFSNSVGPQLQLSWTASTGSPQGYIVQQSTDSVNFTQIQTVSSTSTTIQGLTVGTTYYFRVYAYNQGGLSSGYASGQTTFSQ